MTDKVDSDVDDVVVLSSPSSSSSSFTELPTAIQTGILSYLLSNDDDGYHSICAIEQTSKSLYVLVEESNIWKRLHQQRWTVSATITPNEDDLTTTTTTTTTTGSISNTRDWWKRDYQRRRDQRLRVIDQKVQHCLNRLLLLKCHTTTTTTTTTVNAEETRMLLSTGLFDDIMCVLMYGKDALNYCYKSYYTAVEEQEEVPEILEVRERNELRVLVAFGLLRSLHCSIVLEQFQELCQQKNQRAINDPSIDLEDFVMSTCQMFFTIKNEQQTSEEGRTVDTTTSSDWVRKELDDIAVQVQNRCYSAASQTATTTATIEEQKMEALHYVLFEELGFSANTTNSYDFGHTMLHTTLQRRTGIPMTLAIIYKCVAHRIG